MIGAIVLLHRLKSMRKRVELLNLVSNEKNTKASLIYLGVWELN